MAEEANITIPEAAEKWPTSKAHAFKLKSQKESVYYFRIDNPEFKLGHATIRCHVKCLKFDKEDGYMVITNLPIKNDDEIIAITIKHFVDLVNEKLAHLLTIEGLNPDKLAIYENMGFYKKPETSSNNDETVAEILQKPN